MSIVSNLGELSIPIPELPVALAPNRSRMETTGMGRQGHFLRGPIPLDWLQRAASLSGRALHVGVALWYLDGFERSGTVKAQPSVLREFHVDRHAAYRALKTLEKAGLISVERKRGKAPAVMIRVPQ